MVMRTRYFKSGHVFSPLAVVLCAFLIFGAVSASTEDLKYSKSDRQEALRPAPPNDPTTQPAEATGKIQVYFFHAKGCPSCKSILESYLPALRSLFPSLEVRTFDVENPSDYEALAELEKKFNRRGEEFPVVFIGDHLLAGEMEVMEKLNPLILEYQMRGGATLPPIASSASFGRVGESKRIDLAYFYQKGCPKCDRASYLLKYVQRKYSNVNIKEIELNTAEGKRLNETLSNRLNVPEKYRLIAPMIFIGKDYLSPESITESNVEALIQKYEKAGAESPFTAGAGEMRQAEKGIIERFRSLGLLAILSAGLIEGLNPCAFATLIFFISYLTMVGRKREEIFRVGMGFSAASFFTHLVLGLGILNVVQNLSFLPSLTRAVYLITLLFSLLLGTLSLYDYLQLKRGRPSKMKLQVPDFLKERIHRIIRKGSGGLDANSGVKPSSRLLVAAVVIGFLVTLLQSTCTSQVYLPTILFVTSVPSLRGSALLYLTLYNLVYVVPLVAVFTVVYRGTSSEQLALFLQRRASTIKLLTAFFFFGLAGIVLVLFI
jgi:glutaredoxin